MSSHSTTALLLHLRSPTTTISVDNSLLSPPTANPLSGATTTSFGHVRLRCKAISKPRTEAYTDVIQNGLPVIKWDEVVEDDTEQEQEQTLKFKVSSWSNKTKEYIRSIQAMLRSMDDGEITISAYDTAWVALVEDIHGSGAPQFPSSLEWIANNQLDDGSWGDRQIFEAHDRIINTLACVIALKNWNIHPEKRERGLLFIKENIKKLENEKAEHMPIGFEVAFPSLIETAQKLDIQVPNDSPVLQEIYQRRNLKLTRIPKDIMHLVPTTLLHSLEGMAGLEWEKLLKLQCPDGSFLFSPSSTAFALMQTQDHNCLRYLTNAVDKFNGGVPNVYPVDLFEHIWVVDRLERLGISRFFQPEIKQCVDYIHKYWTKEGICWARNSVVHDIDDTAMGFRVLRSHGHQVSADVFRHFKKGGEFFCFAGQSNQAVTGMFNLLRASHLLFPGEKILEEANNFSSKFLREKQASNGLFDKWIIMKDLPGEVGYALDMPWYASLPRVETSFYLEQYGGEDDVWIGKTLYRMPYVNNNTYLELARLDFNNCQALHQLEWDRIQRWYKECNFGELGLSQRSLLLSYYLAAASIFEPERSKERLAWAKTAILTEIIGSFFTNEGNSEEMRRKFLQEFRTRGSRLQFVTHARSKKMSGHVHRLMEALLVFLNQLSFDTLVANGRDIRHHLRDSWEMWMMTWQEDGDWRRAEAELLTSTMNLCVGRMVPEELTPLSSHYKRLCSVMNNVCHQLCHFRRSFNDKVDEEMRTSEMAEIESNMQELAQLVLSDSSDGMDGDMKQTFLTVAKTYYYRVHCSPSALHSHISRVLFEKAL